MKCEIKVSIIVPVYNAEKYIDRCIKSLIEQTYKNIEIILVNDGSKDNSLNIIKNYSNVDGRIIVIDQENSGPSAARNIGIEKSQGYYIAFIDADDYVEISYIEDMLKKTYDLNADIVVCNYIEIRNNGEILSKIFKFIKDDEIYKKDEICLGEVLCGRGGLVWGKIFKKSIIQNNNIKFNKDINMCEDLLFCLEFIKHTNIIAKNEKYLYIHNKCNNDSITAKYNKKLFIDQIRVQNSIELFIKNNDMYSIYIESLIYERLKGILWFCIYKEVINKMNLRQKLINISEIIRNKIITENIDKFSRNGYIDKAILTSIKNNNSVMVYFFSCIRIKISDYRMRINSSN